MSLTKFRCVVLLLLFVGMPAGLFAQAATPGLADFDTYVQRVMQDWKVPGAAIAIVKDGKVILSKGYSRDMFQWQI
jgi:CubicO group peptidase (beta-lactamase class C family)